MSLLLRRRIAPEFRERRRTAQTSSLGLTKILAVSNLLRTHADRAVFGGQAPGLDGMGYHDAGPSELAAIYRQMGVEIRRGSYRPGRPRLVRVPKPSGGFRTLRLRSVTDRVLSTAIMAPLQLRAERLFLPGNHGSRRRLSVLTLLAQMDALVGEAGYIALAHDDIAGAFDHLRIADAIEFLSRLGVRDDLRDLIRVILPIAPNVTVGIPQGDPLSPLALNGALHDLHDSQLANTSTRTPWFRYVDDVAYLGHTVPEAEQARRRARDLLGEHGLTLNTPTTVDLRESTVEMLGVNLTIRTNRLQVQLSESAWQGLTNLMLQAHDEPNPPRRAKATLTGWLSIHAAALRRSRREMDRIRAICAQCEFQELAGARRLTHWIERSMARWENALRQARPSRVTAMGFP